MGKFKAARKAGIPIKKKLMALLIVFEIAVAVLIGRVFYITAYEAEFLQTKAFEQQTRDRLITPDRGSIFDRNMVGIAVTETVSSVSVIRAQIQDRELVAQTLSRLLGLDYDEVMAKVSKKVALERIQTKVDKDIADELRRLGIPGIVVDEDVKRVYPYSTLAAQVIGFVGRDNQGIVGLEAKYDGYLKGVKGKILTQTDARGVEVEGGIVRRIEPQRGYNLVTSLDVVIQQYAEQTIKKVVEAKGAKRGLIIAMNPQNGEILALANEPTFDLNEPFTINSPELAAVWDTMSSTEQLDALNQMWRNFAINDTYEPGSTFKVVTSAAGLEEGVITPESRFVCTGSKTIANRIIKCWRSPRSHGSESFVEGVLNSCNPVFMEVAEKLGVEKFYEYLLRFGMAVKTGVDLPGEAVGILHKQENMGPVELATMSFGQSFQITPLQLLRAASATVNGGYLVTPHVGAKITDEAGNIIEDLSKPRGEQVISAETSQTMKEILEMVVEVGTGNRTYIPGYRVGGKTATSEKLPRRTGKYISSFMAFSPSENPEIIVLVLVDEPKGAYYGGQVTGPVMKEFLESVLPYIGIEPVYSEAELEKAGVAMVSVPDLRNQDYSTAIKTLATLKLNAETRGEGDTVSGQFPLPGELVNQGSDILLYLTR